MVFSTDGEADKERIPEFMVTYGAPFPPVYIERWAPGEFTEAMAGVGIQADMRQPTRVHAADEPWADSRGSG